MIYFRCDVSKAIGWGNLKRCLVLAESLNKFTSTCFLMPEPNDQVIQEVEKRKSTIHAFPEGLTYRNEINYYPRDCKNLIVDLGYRQNLECPENFLEYLHDLNENNYSTIIMDGLDDDSFRDERAPTVKAYIQPYVGVNENNPPNAEYWLYGPEYTLLDKIYEGAYRKRSVDRIKNILVTFGGADPQNLSLIHI